MYQRVVRCLILVCILSFLGASQHAAAHAYSLAGCDMSPTRMQSMPHDHRPHGDRPAHSSADHIQCLACFVVAHQIPVSQSTGRSLEFIRIAYRMTDNPLSGRQTLPALPPPKIKA